MGRDRSGGILDDGVLLWGNGRGLWTRSLIDPLPVDYWSIFALTSGSSEPFHHHHRANLWRLPLKTGCTPHTGTKDARSWSLESSSLKWLNSFSCFRHLPVFVFNRVQWRPALVNMHSHCHCMLMSSIYSKQPDFPPWNLCCESVIWLTCCMLNVCHVSLNNGSNSQSDEGRGWIFSVTLVS